MELFKITKEHFGKTIQLKPILNVKDLKNPILSYKIGFNNFYGKWIHRHLCFCIVDDKVVPIEFSKSIYDFLSKNQSVLFLNNDQFLNIEVFDKQGFLDYNITILNDPKYDYSKTQEDKDKLLSMFGDADLHSILLDRKNTHADIEVDIFGKKTKLRDVYIEEDLAYTK